MSQINSNETENKLKSDSNNENSSIELLKDLYGNDRKELTKTSLQFQFPSLSEFNLSRIKEERVISHAQETVESLNRQLDLKREMVAKYRAMLKTTRHEFLEKLEGKEFQIKELQEKIHSFSLKEIERFQSQSLIFDSQIHLLDKEEHREEELKVETEMMINLQKMNELKDEKIKSNQEEMQKSEMKIQELREDMQEKEKRIKAIQEENCIEIERLTRELNGLKEEKLDFIEKSSQLNQKIENEKELLILNNQFHSENVLKLKSELELKSKKIKNIKNEIQEWKVKVSSFSGELENLKASQNNFSRDEIFIQDQMSMKIGRLDVKNKRLELALRLLLDEKRVISKENEELKKELDQAKFHLIERNHELAVLRKTIEMYKSPHSSGKPIEELINQLLSTSSLKQRGNTSLWNLEKKEQKKMELLREKLKENILKVEELSSYNMQLKENLYRNEKDRLRIMTELQSIKAKPSTPALENAHINEINKLNGKVQTLQAALVKASDHFKTTQAKDVVNHDHLTLFDKKNADLQQKVQDMILELKKEQKTATTHITKLSDENQKLRSRLKKEGEKSESIVKQLLSLSVEIDGYKSEISLLKGTIRAYSRESINEDKTETIRNLKKELDEKDRAIYELMTTEGSSGKVVSENRKLRREMEVMEMRVEKLSHLPINLLNA